ncbi:MAG: hydrogenase nickel incorporation protein HypB [Bacteroidota bacterium]
MCDTCGCSNPDERYTLRKPGQEVKHTHDHDHPHTHDHTHDGEEHTHSHHHHEEGHHHDHSHDHEHSHDHTHEHPHSKEIRIEQDVLGQNQLLAERNRGYFEAKGITALNLVSSPGSGKTTLLEKIIAKMKNEIPFFVIEGDQQTMNDAERIEKAGAAAIQINTGSGCHLDAEMVNKAVKELNVPSNALLLIENVGNLVCPALFDLGEKNRIVIISVTEGDDKPLKYPYMFASSQFCIINKIDLLPYVDFSVEKVKENALRINSNIRFFEVSARNGEGMDAFGNWLKEISK